MCVPDKFSSVKVTNCNRWHGKNLIGQTHTPYLCEMRVGPSAYVALKKTYAANRKRQAKRELQVVGSHPQQLQVFLEKVEAIKVSLYIVSLILRLTSPLHATRV